jgi:bisphosphoglycerate-independent phosphoglycerate mutase (AlkP superfamily)
VSRTPAERQFLEKGSANELSPGIHGHRPGDQRTQAIFYAIGPDFSHRKTGRITMIDVAPTVLQLLQIPKPPYMEGKSVIAKDKP